MNSSTRRVSASRWFVELAAQNWEEHGREEELSDQEWRGLCDWHNVIPFKPVARGKRFRLAVQAAIHAYEKSGDARCGAGVCRARLPGVSADHQQDAGPAARQGCQRQADPRHRRVQEGDHRSDPDPRVVERARVPDRPADGRGVRRVVPRRRHLRGSRRRRRGVG